MDFFPGATFLITEGNAYFFSKYLQFDVMGDAYFKGLRLMFLPNVPGATFIPGALSIPESKVVIFLTNHLIG